jgi:hypothetical protein
MIDLIDNTLVALGAVENSHGIVANVKNIYVFLAKCYNLLLP